MAGALAFRRRPLARGGRYIRRTQTRNPTTGERSFTHRLVRSERIVGKVRQVTLLNLGRHCALPQAE